MHWNDKAWSFMNGAPSRVSATVYLPWPNPPGSHAKFTQYLNVITVLSCGGQSQFDLKNLMEEKVRQTDSAPQALNDDPLFPLLLASLDTDLGCLLNR